MSIRYYEEDPLEPDLNFEPLMYEEEIYELNDHQLTNSINGKIEIAIDDYIDPEAPISFKKQKKEMDDMYERLKRQKELERKSLGVPKKKKKRPPKDKKGLEYKRYMRKKKKSGLESSNRHFKGGWNTDVRTKGNFDNLSKNELDMDGVWREKKKSISRRKKSAQKSKNGLDKSKGKILSYF